MSYTRKWEQCSENFKGIQKELERPLLEDPSCVLHGICELLPLPSMWGWTKWPPHCLLFFSIEVSLIYNIVSATQLYIHIYDTYILGSPAAQTIRNLPALQDILLWSLGREGPLEKGIATHSSIPAWRIPWTEKPGRLQFMGFQRVVHNWANNTSTFSELIYNTELVSGIHHSNSVTYICVCIYIIYIYSVYIYIYIYSFSDSFPL